MVAWLPILAIGSLLASLGGTALQAQAMNAAINRQRRMALAAQRQGEAANVAAGQDTLSALRNALTARPQSIDYSGEDATARRRFRTPEPIAPEVAIEAARHGDAGAAVGAQRALADMMRREGAMSRALARSGAAIGADQASRARLVQALLGAAQQPQGGYSLFGDLLYGLGQFGQMYAFAGGLGGGKGGDK